MSVPPVTSVCVLVRVCVCVVSMARWWRWRRPLAAGREEQQEQERRRRRPFVVVYVLLLLLLLYFFACARERTNKQNKQGVFGQTGGQTATHGTVIRQSASEQYCGARSGAATKQRRGGETMGKMGGGDRTCLCIVLYAWCLSLSVLAVRHANKGHTCTRQQRRAAANQREVSKSLSPHTKTLSSPRLLPLLPSSSFRRPPCALAAAPAGGPFFLLILLPPSIRRPSPRSCHQRPPPPPLPPPDHHHHHHTTARASIPSTHISFPRSLHSPPPPPPTDSLPPLLSHFSPQTTHHTVPLRQH